MPPLAEAWSRRLQAAISHFDAMRRQCEAVEEGTEGSPRPAPGPPLYPRFDNKQEGLSLLGQPLISLKLFGSTEVN